MTSESFFPHAPETFIISRAKHNSFQLSPDTSFDKGYQVAATYKFDLYFGAAGTAGTSQYQGSVDEMLKALQKAAARHKFLDEGEIRTPGIERQDLVNAVSQVLNVPASSLDYTEGGPLDLDMLSGGDFFEISVNATQISNYFRDPDNEMKNFRRLTADPELHRAIDETQQHLDSLNKTRFKAIDTFLAARADASLKDQVYHELIIVSNTAAGALELAKEAKRNSAAYVNQLENEVDQDGAPTDPDTLVAAQNVDDAAHAALLAATTASDVAEKDSIDASVAAADAANAHALARASLGTVEETLLKYNKEGEELRSKLHTSEMNLLNPYDPGLYENARFQLELGDVINFVVKLESGDDENGGHPRYLAHEFKLMGRLSEEPTNRQLVRDDP